MTQLEQLAQLYGIQTSYLDMTGNPVTASPEAMLTVLRSLGAPVSTPEDVPSAITRRLKSIWQRLVEPVAALRENTPHLIRLRLPTKTDSNLHVSLKLESGQDLAFDFSVADLPVLDSALVDGESYLARNLALPQALPTGYHRLHIEIKDKSWESLLIVSPDKAYSVQHKLWGVFLPLYALHSKNSWGAGDFSDMQKMIDWLSQLGGGLAATLPFLASFEDTHSPYAPASRLFWNEFYIDLTTIPEFVGCPSAQALVSSTEFQQEMSDLRSSTLVDYKRQTSLKRRALEELAHCFFAGESERSADFRRFLASHPALEDYARFRAACERHGTSWSDWQDPMRSGVIRPGDYPESSKQYHLYVQWIAAEQIAVISQKAQQNGCGLYLDLPIGVHPCGYDVWRERDTFACDASVGAPPDPVFTSGQNWSFPPMHPEKIRTNGYRYLISCLRHHLSRAGMLRIDHVMGFHRLFWIPTGLKNSDGLYVNYHSDEFYAILALESRRHKSVIVGEDLGLVPPEVRTSMADHGLYRSYVAQYELISEKSAFSTVPEDSVASLNTHDMFPFAAFWQGLDIEERQNIGMIDAATAHAEAEYRREQKNALLSLLQAQNLITEASSEVQSVLRGMLRLLGASPARTVLVNLEDLWLETHPQNIPGTIGLENWRCKARYSLEELSQIPQITETLKDVDHSRKDDQFNG